MECEAWDVGRGVFGGSRAWRAWPVCWGASPRRRPGHPNTYVDANYAGPNGASDGDILRRFSTINAAFAAVGSGVSALNPNYIYFAPGTYNVGTTSLSYSKNNVDLIGLSGNPNDVVITSTLDSAYNTGSGTIGTSGSATLQLKGNNSPRLISLSPTAPIRRIS